MTAKITIEAFNLAHTGPEKSFFLVSNDIDVKVIDSFQQGGAKVSMGNESLTNWTPSKGIGEWEQYPLRNATVYVAFPLPLSTNKKVKNFLAELKTYMEAAGAKFYVLEMPAGRQVAEAFHGATYGNYKDILKEFVPAFTAGDEESEEATKMFDMGHADFAYEVAESDFYFCRSENKEYFLLPKTDELPNLAYMVGEADLRHVLTRKFQKESGNVVGQGALLATMDAISAQCAVSPHILDAKFRIASSGDGYNWMDLGTDDGKAIRWNGEGWELIDRVPNTLGFAFRRADTIKALPVPAQVSLEEAGDTLKKYLKPYINVADEQWPLIVAFLINHITPNYKRPILLLTSEAEAGKTTATMAVKFAVEGAIDRGREMPTKPDDIAVVVSAARMTNYNNISKIDKTMSDFLCQVQGDSEYEKRKLRTDNDRVNLKLVSSVIMNGITTGEIHGDLKTRLVRLELQPLDGKSKLDHEIDQALKAMHPEILGAILTLAVEVAKRMPNVPHPGKGFRMLEFTQILMALSDIWDLGNGPMKEYKAVMDSLSAEALDDPLFEVIRSEVLKMSNRASSTEFVWEAEVGSKDIINAFNSFNFSKAAMSAATGKTNAIENGQQLAEQFRRGITSWKRHGVSYVPGKQKTVNGQRQTPYKFRFEGAEWFEMASAH
jgi:hypothetical protein